MKNYPLSLQIWMVVVIITLSISAILSFILPTTLRNFFTNEIYATIDSAQDLIFNQFDSDVYRDYLGSDFFGGNNQKLQDIRTVNHFIIFKDNNLIVNSPKSKDFINKIINETKSQNNLSNEYSGNLEGEKVFYIITKGKALGRDAFLISYMGDSYRDDLVKTLFRKLLNVVILVAIFSFIPALLLSNYLTRPLVDLEKRVDKLANNEWDESIQLDRKDEIGRLGASIERLRERLIRQDESEQSFLQNVSHELKTPVMVIRSFAQAINEGIYPKGDLRNSIDVIDSEANTLEKKIKNLLYMTKLDYLSNYGMEKEEFSLDLLVKEVIERFTWTRADLDWSIKLSPLLIEGNKEQWRVVIENLLDNQIRYAHNEILISLEGKTLQFYNDGPSIEENTLNTMFSKFNKGHKGEFGLGLAIVYRILLMHNSSISVVNEENGVSFYIEI